MTAPRLTAEREAEVREIAADYASVTAAVLSDLLAEIDRLRAVVRAADVLRREDSGRVQAERYDAARMTVFPLPPAPACTCEPSDDPPCPACVERNRAAT